MRYFGYGSNLNTADLARWCEAHGFTASGIRELGPAWLPDHEPVFHYLSVARDGGALSVRPRLGAATPGCLFSCDDEGWRALDRKEGAKYERVTRRVLFRGEDVEATTYVVASGHREDDLVAPQPAYLKLVTDALATRSLPTSQVREAARGLRIPPLPDALFVYGTLRRGESRERLLTDHAPTRWSDARVRGRLLDLGAYPGMVAGEGEVVGELVRFDALAELIRALDEVEAFEGYGRSGSLYRRVIVWVGDQPAWSYRFLSAHEGVPIASGDWRDR